MRHFFSQSCVHRQCPRLNKRVKLKETLRNVGDEDALKEGALSPKKGQDVNQNYYWNSRFDFNSCDDSSDTFPYSGESLEKPGLSFESETDTDFLGKLGKCMMPVTSQEKDSSHEQDRSKLGLDLLVLEAGEKSERECRQEARRKREVLLD